MEKILWNDNQYINCRANDEPLGITSTVDDIVLEISDYKPYKGKYRQCKSYTVKSFHWNNISWNFIE